MKNLLLLSALAIAPVLFSCGSQKKDIPKTASDSIAAVDPLQSYTVKKMNLMPADSIEIKTELAETEKKNPVAPAEKKEDKKKEVKESEKEKIKKIIVDAGRERNEDRLRNYHINSYSVSDDVLTIELRYKGGCGQHDFSLYSNNMLKKSLPPQIDIYLEHQKENETCKEEITQTFKYDISAIRKPGNPVIILNFNNADNKLEWKIE